MSTRGHTVGTAENLTVKWGITREEQDALAVESHRGAATAIAENRFKWQIVAIIRKTKKGDLSLDADEHVKPATTLESLGKLTRVQEGRRHGDGRHLA